MLKYWIWLTLIETLSPLKQLMLLNAFTSPEELYYNSDFRELSFLSSDERGALSDKSLDKAEHILEQCDIKRLHIVTLQDAQYPRRLKEIDDPPPVLYVKGKLNALALDPAIAIVGTRDATPYGLNNSAVFAYNLAKRGMIIVSGMAKGIDAMAHKGALRAGRQTIAVLGSGADVPYPAECLQLYEDIANHGAVISEFPPGTRPVGSNFPRRNRIVSGLSLGVIVAEAPLVSGALITARTARNQGRNVFAVPGSIDAPNSAGCNAIIKDFAALVDSPADIINEYVMQYPVELGGEIARPAMPEPPKQLPEKSKRKKPDIPLTPVQARIVESISNGAFSAGEIAEASGLDIHETLSELTMLEIAGAVTGSDTGVFALNI